jgi:16S rRNA G966 N2-methylase RsmD
MSSQIEIPFKKKYTLEQRKEKAAKQKIANPDKTVIIVERHKKSKLPPLDNPRYIYNDVDFYVTQIISLM